MEVLRPDDAPTFLRLAGPLLERDEARNQLPLGIAGTLADHPDAYDVVSVWVVRDGGRRSPRPSGPSRSTSSSATRRRRRRSRPSLDAVPGRRPRGPRCRRQRARMSSGPPRRSATATEREPDLVLSQGRVRADGRARRAEGVGLDPRAGAGDRGLLVAWLRAFAEEAIPTPRPSSSTSNGTSRHVSRPTTRASGCGRPTTTPCRCPATAVRPDRHPRRARLHAARAPRPRIRDDPRRRSEPLAPRTRSPRVLPVHRPLEPDVEPHLRPHRLRARL